MKNRLNNLSLCRIIATVAILQFHVFFILYERDIPFEMLMSKGVQGLTALSGFLYSRKKIEDGRAFLLKSAKKLLPPAILCFLIMALWNLVYMLAAGGNYIALFFDHRAYNGSLLVQPGNYYYILYIFICYAITPYLAKSRKSRVVLTATVALVELAIGFLFGTSIIATAYLVGYIVGRRNYEAYTEGKYRLREPLVWAVILALSLGGYALAVGIPTAESYLLSHLHSLAKNITSAAFGTATFFLLAALLKFLNGERQYALLKCTDALSLNIFLLNQTFMCGAMNVAAWTDIKPLGIFLVYLFTVVTAILVTLITPYITAKLGKSVPK